MEERFGLEEWSIHIFAIDHPTPPTCVSAALACWRTCAQVAPVAAMLCEEPLVNVGGVRGNGQESVLQYLINNNTSPKLTTTPSLMMRSVTWSPLTGPCLHFCSLDWRQQRSFPPLRVVRSWHIRICPPSCGLHDELSVERLRGTRDSRRYRPTTTHTPDNSFKMVNSTARAILDMGGSADGWI